MKLVLFTDSLGMPRPPGMGNVPFEVTYPARLERALREDFPSLVFTHRGKRYRTVLDVLDEWQEEVEYKRADAVVIQVGCNDAAPRLLLPREREWIRSLPWTRFRTQLLRLEDRYRHRVLRHLERVCVSEGRFERALQEIVRRAAACGVRRLFFLNMHACTQKIEDRLPGAFANRERYNQILDALRGSPGVEIVDMNGLIARHGGAERFTIDGLHLNAEGSRLFAEELERSIRKAFGTKKKNLPPRRQKARPEAGLRDGVHA